MTYSQNGTKSVPLKVCRDAMIKKTAQCHFKRVVLNMMPCSTRRLRLFRIILQRLVYVRKIAIGVKQNKNKK